MPASYQNLKNSRNSGRICNSPRTGVCDTALAWVVFAEDAQLRFAKNGGREVRQLEIPQRLYPCDFYAAFGASSRKNLAIWSLR
jgi:hypothetical protein